jgi:predicted acyl esterase
VPANKLRASEIRGPKNRSSVQEREDVLFYTTEPLTEDIEVTGPVDMKLYTASSAVNTDFTATLTDVHPDGVAIHICESHPFRNLEQQFSPLCQKSEHFSSLWNECGSENGETDYLS